MSLHCYEVEIALALEPDIMHAIFIDLFFTSLTMNLRD